MSTDSVVLSDADLDALEASVAERYLAAMADKMPTVDFSEWLDDIVPWAEWTKRPLPCDPPIHAGFEFPPFPTDFQFPREKWITYRNRRAVALTLASALLSHNMLFEAGWLLMYGGRERVA